MKVSEIRRKYLEFFEQRGHAVIPSASLLPENDPTTLFTGSGMQPLIPYLLGEKHPAGVRIVDSQKSFRAQDIEEVGDNRHTTFFEMLGNWSLGDYFKKEQLAWFFEFLTDVVGVDPQKLYVSVFAGDPKNDLPRDDESVGIWKELFAKKGIEAKDVELITEERGAELGMGDGRIFYYGSAKNWWSRAGEPEKMPSGEPGGPDSEVFYDFGTPHDTAYGAHCHPNCDCGRFMEIGNSVFMQYKKKEDGGFEKLAQQNVDFGGGLERIAAAANNEGDVFKIDVFAQVIKKLEERFPKKYSDPAAQRLFRITADHLRAAIFLVADGVLPSNKDRGYVLRRLVRRAAFEVYKIAGNTQQEWLSDVVDGIITSYVKHYEYLGAKQEQIKEALSGEARKFYATLEGGLKVFNKYLEQGDKKLITGEEAFVLFTTYGFPLELTKEKAKEVGLEVDEEGFWSEFRKHQELSRTTSAGTFKGGLADHSEKVIRYHTATHLLHSALRSVLGDHVLQKGSNITGERTRFDFFHSAKLTDEQKKQVEDLVNTWIKHDYLVKKEIMPLQQAMDLGALGVFGEKYADTVSIYTVYDPKTNEVVSREFCGGPHVEHTGEIGVFRVTKEEAVSAGIRRIRGEITP